ncbi:putative f-box domain protein [Mycena sanguinolenta]|uniref:Putative f-box domain protein n=1 Tax=Mycena sanguinolenta TaxID=230812 RepID=A0A8H7CYY0_9AGAR|nr:putative f-box domain protein [Mycena sanguinolenta]
MSNSQNAVLSTPELVELTLSHLPIRDLLIIAPLVCKTWQALTLTPALQRALFFEPDPSYRAERVRNPLLMEMFAPFYSAVSTERWTWPTAKDIKWMPWSKAPHAFNRPEASWRRMLVAQPPPRKMLISETCHGRGGICDRRAVLDDQPLRMGRLYDITLPLIDRVVTSFCVRWSHDGDNDSPSDITLSVDYVQQCAMGIRHVLGNQFYNTATRYKTNLTFGDWSGIRAHPVEESDGDPDEESD